MSNPILDSEVLGMAHFSEPARPQQRPLRKKQRPAAQQQPKYIQVVPQHPVFPYNVDQLQQPGSHTYTIWLHAAPACYRLMDAENISRHIERIYAQSGVNTIAPRFIATARMQQISALRQAGQLTLNQQLVQIKNDAGDTDAGIFNEDLGIVVNIAPFLELNKEKEGGDLDYQLGYTIAHEILHSLLCEIEKYFQLQPSDYEAAARVHGADYNGNPFNLSTAGPDWFINHVNTDANLLKAGRDEAGNNNDDAIPHSNDEELYTAAEMILPDQVMAINRFITSVNMNVTDPRHFYYWEASRELIINYRRRI
ncbi:MAG: hypothetical protein BGO69_01755 [Bacteroidetes bacterium 46-16]|nr:MAG: hypothetical protein BGO69_01755 [Bacteroidetes bacterium 46-16]